ncbi:MAG TPA: hypothetical protein VK817_11340 [Trebonia sp.]|nr:hypothetical protein [Trebonia sp.]
MTAARRAARLLRWYPHSWRARYGEEFAELLISDIEERPRCAARTRDIVRGGLVAWLTAAGLAGYRASWSETGDAPITSPLLRHVTASLASLGCAAAIFLCTGAAMWSQLTIGWQWSSPVAGPMTRSAAAATVVTSAAMIAILVLAAAAALPVLAVLILRAARYRERRLLIPALVLVTAVTGLFLGGRHFGNGWPGTGGHHGLVPGGLAAFEWALSLSVSSYWAHPAALAAFPATELAWMAVSPAALAVAVASAAICVRRVALPPGILRFEARLAVAACAVMTVFLAGCCWWVATGGQRNLFHAGLIDVAGICVLALALLAARRAARQAVSGLRPARS